MKRLWNAFGKETKSAFFQKKAVKQVEKMEKAEAISAAPHYPTEKEHRERTRNDPELKKAVGMKYEGLVDNVNKIKITSTEPPERWTKTNKDLPTRETEFAHRNDPAWEFGFYEPPHEKIPKGKLTFREALEVLRARQELADDGSTPASAKRREQAKEFLETCPAHERISMGEVDKMFEYFRPFERKDKQRVVQKQHLVQLQERIQGWPNKEDIKIPESATAYVKDGIQKAMQQDPRSVDQYQRLTDKEREEFLQAVAELRSEQKERLEKRLGDVVQMEQEFVDAVKAQRQKTTPEDAEPTEKSTEPKKP
ncbi:unnamed protein product, partial [Mesorhabditis spiculigera]